MWVIKDRSIGSTFFDEGAAVFFLPYLLTAHHSSIPEEKNEDVVKTVPMKRLKYMLDPLTGSIAFLSFAHWEYSSLIQVLLLLAHCHQVRLYVGMLWVLIGAVTWLWEEITKTRWGREIKRRGGYDSSAQCYRHVHVEYQCEVARIFSDHESAGAMDSSLTHTHIL